MNRRNKTPDTSDTFGSSFNSAGNKALEILSKVQQPNAMGWNCTKTRTVKKLSNPSKGHVDEHHFRTDLRKAHQSAAKHTLREIDAYATGMGTWM